MKAGCYQGRVWKTSLPLSAGWWAIKRSRAGRKEAKSIQDQSAFVRSFADPKTGRPLARNLTIGLAVDYSLLALIGMIVAAMIISTRS